jgi:membrane associated rhomboid family serine protease
VAAMVFLGILMAMDKSWEPTGLGQLALWGSIVGFTVGLPLSALMSLTSFKNRLPSKAGLWAISCAFPYGVILTFLAFVGSCIWNEGE